MSIPQNLEVIPWRKIKVVAKFAGNHNLAFIREYGCHSKIILLRWFSNYKEVLLRAKRLDHWTTEPPIRADQNGDCAEELAADENGVEVGGDEGLAGGGSERKNRE